jgi:hypothetical protein
MPADSGWDLIRQPFEFCFTPVHKALGKKWATFLDLSQESGKLQVGECQTEGSRVRRSTRIWSETFV